MKKILDFLSFGKVNIADLEIMELMELLEATRLMCLELDSLFRSIETQLRHFIDLNKDQMPTKTLMALD